MVCSVLLCTTNICVCVCVRVCTCACWVCLWVCESMCACVYVGCVCVCVCVAVCMSRCACQVCTWTPVALSYRRSCSSDPEPVISMNSPGADCVMVTSAYTRPLGVNMWLMLVRPTWEQMGADGWGGARLTGLKLNLEEVRRKRMTSPVYRSHHLSVNTTLGAGKEDMRQNTKLRSHHTAHSVVQVYTSHELVHVRCSSAVHAKENECNSRSYFTNSVLN